MGEGEMPTYPTSQLCCIFVCSVKFDCLCIEDLIKKRLLEQQLESHCVCGDFVCLLHYVWGLLEHWKVLSFGPGSAKARWTKWNGVEWRREDFWKVEMTRLTAFFSEQNENWHNPAKRCTKYHVKATRLITSMSTASPVYCTYFYSMNTKQANYLYIGYY